MDVLILKYLILLKGAEWKIYNGVLVKLIKGDITDIETIAIVNPANTSLLLGGGVAGRIREKGGYKIQKECDELKYCPLGEAVITSGGNLKAKYVIHAVGPRYNIDPEPEKIFSYGSILMSIKNRTKDEKNNFNCDASNFYWHFWLSFRRGF